MFTDNAQRDVKKYHFVFPRFLILKFSKLIIYRSEFIRCLDFSFFPDRFDEQLFLRLYEKIKSTELIRRAVQCVSSKIEFNAKVHFSQV